jgi:hypothetical protein
LGLGFYKMGGSKSSSVANSSGSNLPICGCRLPMKLLLSNTSLSPNRMFWKCRNFGVSCYTNVQFVFAYNIFQIHYKYVD